MIDWISHPVTAPLIGEVSLPGDKSISHRALFLASIAAGQTVVHGFSDGEDCRRTRDAFEAMGVHISSEHDGRLVIHGVGKYGLTAPKQHLDCGNSGTTMRLLMGLLAAQPFHTILIGDESLHKRPMARVSLPLQQMGADIDTHLGCAPIFIRGHANLVAIDYTLQQASAQVKTALLLAGLYAQGHTKIFEPNPSRDHTEKMLALFCAEKTSQHLLTTHSEFYLQGTELHIPGDISSAAFFIIAATLIPGSHILIKDVGINPHRMGVIHILRAMGGQIQLLNQRQFGQEPIADIEVQYALLRGVVITKDMVPSAIDEFPILFIAAACATGETHLTGAEELRTKESDRIAVMISGLNQLGISAEARQDGVCIQGGLLQGGCVSSMGDHRVAMAFSIAGALAKKPVTVIDCKPVLTSFPRFQSVANQLGFMIESYEQQK